MIWTRLSAHAITSDAGHEIYRREGRFEAWGPPGSWLELYGPTLTASLQRELDKMGSGAEIKLRASSARACIGIFDGPSDARAACESP